MMRAKPLIHRQFHWLRMFVPTRTYFTVYRRRPGYRQHLDQSYWDDTNDRNDYNGSFPADYADEART